MNQSTELETFMETIYTMDDISTVPIKSMRDQYWLERVDPEYLYKFTILFVHITGKVFVTYYCTDWMGMDKFYNITLDKGVVPQKPEDLPNFPEFSGWKIKGTNLIF